MSLHNFKVFDEGKQKRLVFQASIFGRLVPSAFLTIWLTIWSAGCVTMLYLLIADFSWFFLLFSLPFYAGWFAGATALVYSLFGKRQIIIGSDSIEFVNSVLITVQRRRVPFKELVGLSTPQDEEGQLSLVLKTIGKPITVTGGASKRELDAIARVLRDEIPTLRGDSLPDSYQEELAPRKKRPSESEWELVPAFGDQTVFTNHGQFQPGPLFGLLFINLFWNGIVSVFLVAPFAQFDEGMAQVGLSIFIYIFMIPFVLIGAVMVYLLVVQLLEPFRKTTWEFCDREIARTVQYFGFPFRKSWPVVLDIQMQMTDPDKNTEEVEENVDPFSDPKKPKARWNPIKTTGPNGDSLCGIKFTEKEHVIATWKKLTKGDADWITTKLEKEQGTYRVG